MVPATHRPRALASGALLLGACALHTSGTGPTTTSTGDQGGATTTTTSSCPADHIVCNTSCVDPQTSSQFCGAQGDCSGANAGKLCQGVEQCIDGACKDPCAPKGMTCALSGPCIDTQTDLSHCGACGKSCPSAPHAGATCVAGQCGIACDLGFVDGDHDAGNGCEQSDFLLWLDASQITGADNAPVATWPDASGNKRDAEQNDGTAQPRLYKTAANGKPAVHFDGQKSFLTTPAFTMFEQPSAPRSVVAVFRATDLSVTRFVLGQWFANCSNSFDLGYHLPGGGGADFGLFAGDVKNCTNATVTSAYLTQSVWTKRVVVLLSAGTSPSNVEIYDGATGNTLAMTQNNFGWADGGGYGLGSVPMVIGAADDTGSFGYVGFHQGEIAEIQVWNRVLDGNDRAAVTAYLAHKYP
jgi:hypothetical protein